MPQSPCMLHDAFMVLLSGLTHSQGAAASLVCSRGTLWILPLDKGAVAGQCADTAVWLQDAGMRDLILNVRADEACHSHVNHTFAGMQSYEDNPFVKGNHMVA